VEPKHDQIYTLIREMVKGLTATTNEHCQKEGNLQWRKHLRVYSSSEGVARTGYDETNGSNRLVWILGQNTLIKVTREKQSKTDHHALVEYDPAVTEYPINSYMLFTPPVGRSDKLLPRHRGPYQMLEKSHSIWSMISRHTSITYDLLIMTQPGHLHWQSLSRMSRSSWWNPSVDIVGIDKGIARWNSRRVMR